MESKDLPAEIHPLKSEEGKVPGKGEANAAVKVVPLRTPGRLSRWRTAAFFLSLFLCLIAVFAFSFIIPCPVRPISQKTWNRTYDNTGEVLVGQARKERGPPRQGVTIPWPALRCSFLISLQLPIGS